MYGLKGMTSEAPEVRALLSALTVKVQNCREELNSQEIGIALYGLCELVSGPLNGDEREALAILERVVAELDRYGLNYVYCSMILANQIHFTRYVTYHSPKSSPSLCFASSVA